MGDYVQPMNVQVAIRCRPLNDREKDAGFLHIVQTDKEQNKVTVAHRKLDRSYIYDKVFGPYATQTDVFDQTVKPIVREMMQGFNCTVFAYGQTGTGKTYTMEGDLTDPDHMGIIPRSVHTIFEQLESLQADYTVRVSFLELYNEELADLLVDSVNSKSVKPGKGGLAGGVVLRESRSGGVMVCGHDEVQVLCSADIFRILERGIYQRRTAATLMNKNSSRSHSIFTLKIMIKELLPDGQEVMRHGQLNLVDLAGSECIGRSGATSDRAREAGSINQSLLTLGRVITALVEHQQHIPYRDSKLTRLLQESLGGRARTCIIATITSSSDAMEETLSSLDYALKAKSIENRPMANQKMTKKHMLKEYAGEIENLKSMLQASRDKNGVYLDPAHFEQMESTLESRRIMISELEDGMRAKIEEGKAMRKDMTALSEANTALRSSLETSNEVLRITKEQLDATIANLEEERTIRATIEAELAKTKAALAGTRRKLGEVKIELAATQDVVKEQMKTELELKEQALATQSSLNTASSDIALLHEKTDRQDLSAYKRREVVLAFKKEALVATSALNNAVQSLSSQQKQYGAELRSSLDTILEQTMAGFTELSNKLAETMSQISMESISAANGTKDECDILNIFLNKTSEAVQQCLQAQQQGIAERQKEAEANLGALELKLGNQSNFLRDLASSVSSSISAASLSAEAFVTQHAEELADVRKWTEQKLAEQAEALSTHKAEALSFSMRQRHDVQENADLIIASIQKMVEEFSKKTSEQFEDHEVALGTNYDQSIATCQEVYQTVSTRVGEAGEKAASWSAGIMNDLNSLRENSSLKIETSRSDILGCKTIANAALIAAIDNGKTTSSQAEVAQNEIREGIQTGLSRVNKVSEISSGAATTIRNISEVASSSTEEKSMELLSMATEARESANDVQMHMDVCIQEFSVDQSHTIDKTSTLVDSFVNEATTLDENTGTTPCKKRKYLPPISFSQTRPHDEIMEERRRICRGRPSFGIIPNLTNERGTENVLEIWENETQNGGKTGVNGKFESSNATAPNDDEDSLASSGDIPTVSKVSFNGNSTKQQVSSRRIQKNPLTSVENTLRTPSKDSKVRVTRNKVPSNGSRK